MRTEMFNLFVEDLTVLDCAIFDYQRGPIGMSWRVGIEFLGTLDDEKVVFDFSHAKKAAKRVVDQYADHCFVCPSNLTKQEEDGYISFATSYPFDVKYRAKGHAFCVLDNCSASGLIAWLEDKIIKEINRPNVVQVKLTFREETQDGFYYNYSHGLKQHYGACRRLMHGHRSTIKIFVNGVRDSDLEKQVSLRMADKHLIFRENSFDSSEIGENLVKYTSQDELYELTLPTDRCILYPYETTVENISKEIAEWIAMRTPSLIGKVLTVQAFEGVGKGSIYTINSCSGRYEYYKSHDVLKG